MSPATFGPVDCRNQGKPEVIFDIEVGLNFYMVGFRHVDGRTEIITSRNNQPADDSALARLRDLVDQSTLIGFNCANFDRLVLSAILAGASPDLCHAVAQSVIGSRP